MIWLIMVAVALMGVGSGSALVQAAEDIQADLTRISQQASAVSTVQANFVQEKKMAVFESPVILRGKLFFEKPDAIAWHVLSPVRYAFIVTQGSARQWDGETGSVKAFKLESNPVVRVAAMQLRRWFGGEYTLLTSEYDIAKISTDPEVFACVPHANNPEARMITRVLIQLRKDERYIERITIEEATGDVTKISFEDIHLNDSVPAYAWRAASLPVHD
jgi:outer membrane lipoprotein-sorting protein